MPQDEGKDHPRMTEMHQHWGQLQPDCRRLLHGDKVHTTANLSEHFSGDLDNFLGV